MLFLLYIYIYMYICICNIYNIFNIGYKKHDDESHFICQQVEMAPGPVTYSMVDPVSDAQGDKVQMGTPWKNHRKTIGK